MAMQNKRRCLRLATLCLAAPVRSDFSYWLCRPAKDAAPHEHLGKHRHLRYPFRAAASLAAAAERCDMTNFSYEEAFDRNIGWVTEWEQQALRGKRVAIAGRGGVGGAHLLTLTRRGMGAFNSADFDRYDLANFNRQVGATMDTIGRPKLDVMAEMALAINPELRIRRF